MYFQKRRSAYDKLCRHHATDLHKAKDSSRSTKKFISIQIVHILKITFLKGKKFLCQCQRCTDPSSLSTFSDALLCYKCNFDSQEQKGILIKSEMGKRICNQVRFGTSLKNIPLKKTLANNCPDYQLLNFYLNLIKCEHEMDEIEVEKLLEKIHSEVDGLLNQTQMHSVENFEKFLKMHRKVTISMRKCK